MFDWKLFFPLPDRPTFRQLEAHVSALQRYARHLRAEGCDAGEVSRAWELARKRMLDWANDAEPH